MALNTVLAWVIMIGAVVLILLLVPGVLVQGDEFANEVDSALFLKAKRLERQIETFSCEFEESREARLYPPGTRIRPLPSVLAPSPGTPAAPGTERSGDGSEQPGDSADSGPLEAPSTTANDDEPTQEQIDPHRTPVPEPVQPAQSRTYDSVGDLIEQAVYFVVAPTMDGSGVSTGTAFAISPEYLATNHHVIEGAGDEIFVVSERMEEPIEAEVVAKARGEAFGQDDLAILKIPPAQDGEERAFLPLVPFPERNEEVLASGFPADVIGTDANFQAWFSGGERRAPTVINTRGIVMAIQNQDTPHPLVVHDAVISKGNSGGPLIDQCGRVAGINTFISNREGSSRVVYYALPSRRLLALIDEHDIAHKIVEGVCGVAPRSTVRAPEQPAPDAGGSDDAGESGQAPG